MRTRLLSFFGAVLLAASAVACNGDEETNRAPIIDSVESPETVLERSGSYEIPILVLFHDNDREAITHLRYRLKGTKVEGMVELPAPNPTRESAEVRIVLSKAACAGGGNGKGSSKHNLEITLIDSRGSESHPFQKNVDLQ